MGFGFGLGVRVRVRVRVSVSAHPSEPVNVVTSEGGGRGTSSQLSGFVAATVRTLAIRHGLGVGVGVGVELGLGLGLGIG